MTRITPYTAGGDIAERIDEIVLSGDVHLEMMDSDRAWMCIGDTHFWLHARKGKLVVRYSEGPLPADAIDAPAAVGDAGREAGK